MAARRPWKEREALCLKSAPRPPKQNKAGKKNNQSFLGVLLGVHAWDPPAAPLRLPNPGGGPAAGLLSLLLPLLAFGLPQPARKEMEEGSGLGGEGSGLGGKAQGWGSSQMYLAMPFPGCPSLLPADPDSPSLGQSPVKSHFSFGGKKANSAPNHTERGYCKLLLVLTGR